ncbi:non-ribosomal peptide synthase/polyketide synthase [Mycolicibacterium sp. 050158]|uniref:non-ribosomal peptide synthase/polyketide synthase n=1 Tax=Mycolicibacterium sp. 050158 TaxID=3090602 RepID=UPI00299F08F0|nr:non-ribosomal peptide synthase/polyketide synthase [Mycolicibacterium sp. 050158]MDX1892209.1 non-ribosomal peptide synthase/polyketide synthase [Mycolicibacterium sp. 050158]
MTTTDLDDGLTADDRLELLRQWNDQSWPTSTTTVPAAFARQATLVPDALALVAGETRLTYGELATRAYQLANHLLNQGVQAEQTVAIAVPRSAEMVVAVLAVLATGAAFVPVDPQWPDERRRRVLADTRATSVLVAPGAASVEDPRPIALALEDWTFDGEPACAPDVDVDGDQLAYVIFTSGSTGKPKGAMIRHEAICERLNWQVEQVLGFGLGDASLFKAPLSFDISINEILLPLVSGGYVVVADPGGERDPQYLLDLIAREKVTFVYLVSSMLDVLLDLAECTTLLSGLKHVWCGGEVLTPALFERFRSQLSTTLYHGYGPAEATIGVSHVIYRDSAERIETSIGRPNPHTQLYVLDEDLNPVPVGVGGELYAAGFLLGRGYIHAPGLTGSRFVANPFDVDGSRMYRTGDLARWTADGVLEFLGRADNQVKIRGMRVELEEIEVTLAAHPKVRHAAVVLRQAPSGAVQLTGYVVSNDDVDAAELRSWCAAKLPEHMVPGAFLVLDEFPVTANGKLDRRALPAPPVASVVVAESSQPTDARERAMCEIFADLLGVPAVGPDADFFALGGDSIVAMGLISRSRKLGMRIRPRDVFTLRTPGALASAATDIGRHAASAAVDPVGEIAPTPILAWLDELGHGMNGFFQAVTVHTPVGLTASVLAMMIDALLDCHDVLRASPSDVAAGGLTVPPAGKITAATALTIVEADGDLDERAATERTRAVGRLDPAAGRMVEAVWLDAGTERPGRLILVVHHVVVDGVSLRLLADDLAAAWADVRAGRPIALARADSPFRQWSDELRTATRRGEFTGDEEYWRRVVDAGGRCDPLIGSRPVDPAVDVVATEDSLTVHLDDEVTSRLLGPVPSAIRGGVNDVLVGALALALAEWRDDATTSACLLELEGHGREAEHLGGATAPLDLSRTVGWFTTLFPVLVDPGSAQWADLMSGGAALGAAIKTVKEQLREVPRNGLSYGALRHLSDEPRPDLVVRPQVLFNYLGRFTGADDRPWTLADSAVTEDRDPTMPLPRAIEVNAIAVDGDDGTRLKATFSWPAGVLARAEVSALAALWTDALTAIASSAAVTGPTPSDFPLVTVTQADLDGELAGALDVLPPTPLQAGIYFHSTYADADPYVVQQIVELSGPVDPERLRSAADQLLVRHPQLGAAFRPIADGTVVSVLTGGLEMPWSQYDLAGAEADAARIRLETIAEEQRQRPFDLADPPLMRYALVRLSGRRHVLIQTVHHIVADGWSVPVILAELVALHDDPGAALPAAPRFRDYLEWIAAEPLDAALHAWRTELAGFDQPTRLAEALPRSRSAEGGFGTVEVDLPTEVADGLAEWAAGQGVTLGAVIGAAWGVTLGRLVGRTDVAFGSTVSGRGIEVLGIDDMVGLLINTVVARTRWAPMESLATVVRRFADAQSATFEHHHVALADVQHAVGLTDPFDTLVVIDGRAATDDRSGSIRVESVDVVEAPHYPVTLMVRPAESFRLVLTHDRTVCDTATAERVLELYRRVLATIVAADQTPCSQVEVMTAAQRHRVLAAGAGGPAWHGTVLDLFDERVRRDPTALALADRNRRLTYGELDQNAGRLARALFDAGVRRADVVAVATGRTVDMAVALLAVLRAGAAYLPVDPGYPAARIAFMLADAKPTVVVIDARPLPEHSLPTVAVAAGTSPWDGASVPEPGDAASIVYTSGSTGRPRGTVGSHAALGNRLRWAAQQWSHEDGDVRIAKSSMSFVDGTTELLGALVAGATTVVADEDTARDGAALATLIDEVSAAQVLVVPSLAAAMADVAPERLSAVRRWICSGEPLDAATVTALRLASPRAEIVNSYGSSEVAGDVVAGPVADSGAVTMGRPVPGTRVYVLGPDLDPVLPGATGEVYVGGVQLALGYLGHPATTASRFVADPFTGAGERLYRTGDLARWTPDWTLEFVGRADEQVKINGFRVELGEVETALTELPTIAEAVVTVHHGAAGAARLDAYVVTATQGAIDPAVVRSALAQRLPAHLVPATITPMPRLPLLPNGKRDRRALPQPALATSNTVARTEREALICRTFQAVLGLDPSSPIGIDDDFFALGGDSLLALRVVNRLTGAGLPMQTRELFTLRTPRALEDALGDSVPSVPEPEPEVAPAAWHGLSDDDLDRLAYECPVEVQDVWPLSPLQAGVYYQSTYTDEVNTYLAQNVFDFDHRLDVEAMRTAFGALLSRHDNLRVGFAGEDLPRPVQYVGRFVPATVALVDLSDLAVDVVAARLAEVMREDAERPFDLRMPPLFRLTVIRLPDRGDRLLLTCHFLLWDGWSRELVLRELFALYRSGGLKGALPAARTTYADYLRWVDGRDRTASADAWAGALAGLSEATLVAPEAVGGESTLPQRVYGELSAEVTARLAEHTRTAQTTANTVLTAALGLVLGYETGSADVVFGTTVAGRPPELPGIENVIGQFLNTVPVRVEATPQTTVTGLLRRVEDFRLNLMAHEYLGLGDITRSTGFQPLFDSLYVLQNFLDDGTFTDFEREHGIVGVDFVDTTHYPLTWVLTPGERLTVKLEHRPDVIDGDRALAMVSRFRLAAETLLARPDMQIGDLDLTLPGERAALTRRWHATEHEIGDATIADLLAERTQRCPNETALVFGAQRLTYAELDGRINQLARQLLARGAGTECIVALALPRSIDMVVALFATLRTGAAYLPLELDYPTARLTGMLDDATPVLLVCRGASAELATHQRALGNDVLLLDDPAVARGLSQTPAGELSDAELGAFARSGGTHRLDHPAYVIFTSGSTGRPKGVVTPHRGLTNMQLNHRTAIFDPAVAKAGGRRMRVAHTVSFSFDMSWEELLWLVEGHEVHVCDEELRRDATALVAYCREHRIDVINVTPSYAHHLFEQGLLEDGSSPVAPGSSPVASLAPGSGHPPTLVLLGGEAVSEEVWRRLRELPAGTGYNLYGPTEYTINTLGAGTDDSATPTVGQPIWNTRAYVLDAWLRPVGDGVVGELYIAGAGLARGYLNRAALTADRFVADPFVPGGRMYRTGDLVTRRSDAGGTLDFLGRSDDQVKIRGYRVELGEVAAALSALAGIRQAVAIARPGPTPSVKQLVGYVVPDAPVEDPAALATDLRSQLAKALPDYMVPALYGVVETIPLTVNGKLDVRALPTPVAPATGATRAPRDDREGLLASIFGDVLGIPDIGVDDDFFTLGGDSISSIAVAGRARKAGLVITPRDVFRRRTVAALAAATAEHHVPLDFAPDSGVGAISATPMLAETAREQTPLANFHQSMVLATPPGMTSRRLELVLQAVVDAHDMLRARLEIDGGGWRLSVPEDRLAVSRLLTVRTGALNSAEVEAATAAAATQLAPQDGVMIRAVWYDAKGEPGQLLVVVHHLVIDGVSWRILGDDLTRAWAELAEGDDRRDPPTLDPVPTSFRTWSETIATARFDTEVPYWNEVLSTPDPDLGRRAIDPAVDTAETVRSHAFSLPSTTSAALLSSVPAAIHGGVDDVLLTAFSLALARWRAERGHDGGTAALVNLEGHGREADLVPGDLDLSRTIGWFTAIYPVRVDPGRLEWSDVLAAGPALAAATKSVKEQLRSVPSRGLGYGVLRHLDETRPLRGAAPQILFNYLGRFSGGSGRAWEPVAGFGALREGVDPTNPAVTLEINALAEDGPDGTVLTVSLAWPGGLLDDADIAELADRWTDALTALSRCEALAGHTPSDFPLIEVSQADLDDWQRTGPVEDVLPLLPLQEGMYFHGTFGQGLEGHTDTYRVQQIAVLTGPVDVDALRASVIDVVTRHQALRASFRELHDGRLAQIIWAAVPVEFTYVDAADRSVEDIAREQLSRPFDLATAPLVRYVLVSVGAGEHRLIQTLHHIVADGWSYPVIFGDVVAYYHARLGIGPAPAPLAATLRDHVEAVLATSTEAARQAWSGVLADVEATTLVPPPESGTPEPDTVGEHRSSVRHLTPELTRALVETARSRGVTAGAVLHGAWGLLLGRLLGRRRVVFGSTVSGRGGALAGTESIVGLLINTIPVPMSWDHDTPIETAMAELQDTQSAVLDAQYVGLTETSRLAGARDLFDTMVVVENFPTVADERPNDARALAFQGFTGTDAPHYPVSLVAYLDDRLTVEIKYDAGKVTAASADRYAEHVERILTAFAERPDAPICDIDVRTDAERRLGSDAETRVGPDRTLAAWFTGIARRHTDDVAVTCGGARMTYGELDERATAVAATLIELGVGPESRVAVALPRSLDLVVGLVAVVKAGGTYVPLDVDSPAARLHHIVTDSDPVCVLVDRADRLPADAVTTATSTIVLAEAAGHRVDGPVTPPRLEPDHAAYVIYTSGSTGVPKGVTITHRNVAALFDGTSTLFDVGPDDVWTMFHSAAFDFSVWELWGPLLRGGRLVVVDTVVARDPDRFVELLSTEGVTVLNQTPSAFYPLIEADRRLRLPMALRYVVFGGEALDPSRLAEWYRRHDARSPQLVNMYGITETCVHVSHRRMQSATPERGIGGPIPGLRIHLLDAALQPVPVGVVGEMYVAGGQLARGYVGLSGLTATRFVANPFDAAGERLYRSGDTAMWTESGELVYVGRSDQQVKVRGYRIELGEVESALSAQPGVVNAAAAVHHDETGRARLIGYLVGRDAVDVTDVRNRLTERLPSYMVPSALVALDALPLTVNGKLNRAALPAPADRPAAPDPAAPDPAAPVPAAPGTAAELLAALCSEILGAAVGVDDDFFTMGGDSIVAIQLVNRARKKGVQITPQQVFVCRTPGALAEAAVPAAPPVADADDSGPDLGEVMLTPIVQRLAELGGTIDRLNQSEVTVTPTGATLAELEAALNAVTHRHDAFGLRLHRPVPMLWSLETAAAERVSILRVDAEGFDEDGLRAAIAAQSDAAADRLRPDSGTLVAAVWFDRGPQRRGRLLLTVHHLAIDGVSWRIVLDDLAEAFEQVRGGRTPVLPAVATSIRSHARIVNEGAQQAARLAEFEHWTSTLAPGGELDPGADTVGLTVGATRDHELRLTAAETLPLLTTVPAMANADVTETLLAGLYLAVGRWRDARGIPDRPLVLDLERHGRDGWGEEVDLSRTVGWFTAIAPVRLPSRAGTDHVAVLKEVKERLRAVSGLGFGQLRYCNPRTAAALGRLPAPQLLFNYLGRGSAGDTGDWTTAPEADALRAAPNPDLGTPYLLEVNAFCEDTADGPVLRATLTYADGEMTPDAAESLAKQWSTVLRELSRLADDAGGGAFPRGGLTPSDLPLVQLTQAQIDQIEATSSTAVEDIWPLSPLQEGVYFQARYAQAAVYIVQNVFDFTEPIDATALRTAYSAVMRRHPVLRSAFLADDLPGPVAAIMVDPVCEPELVDLTDVAPEHLADRIAELTAADRLRTFDLGSPPLTRMTIIRATDRDRLILSYHFLLLDGWSREGLLNDLFAEYAAATGRSVADRPVPRARFTDYLRWLADRDGQAAADRWAAALAELPAPTLLVPAAVGTEPTLALRLDFTLTESQTAALVGVTRAAGVTLNAAVSTALAMVLGYESGTDDVVFGSTVAGRPTELDGIEDVVGLFLNTVPTRVRLRPDRTVTDTMRAVQSERLELMDHEYLGLGEIQRAAGVNGPLFDSLYVLQNFLDDDTFTDMESEYGIVGHDSVDASHYPLTWVASPGRRLWVKLEYRPDVVQRPHAQRLLHRLQRVLLHIGEHGEDVLAAVPMQLHEEQAELVARAEATRHPLPEATVMDLLAERSARTPSETALVCGGERIDYGLLDARVNQLAWVLRHRGIGPEQTVALAIPRSIDAVVALFAVLRAGAAYLALELDYPDERLAVMLADAAPVCLLTTSAVATRIGLLTPESCAAVVLDAASARRELVASRLDWDGYAPSLDHPAYVIYTSGSTGKPKGVVTPHRGLTNMHLNHREAIFAPAIAKAGGRRLRIAHTVSFSFDMSWEELLWLIEGHEVHVCDEDLRRDATALVAYCHQHRIDVVNVTPSYAQLLFDQGLLDTGSGHPPVLVLLGGEAVSTAVWDRLRDSETSYGYNLYGPTEYTINTLGGGTDDSATSTVGVPIWNTRAHVLDAWLRPVPDGVAGELYIAGAGLARGYLGQPALSAGRFVANPDEPGGRMYRTGDLVARRRATEDRAGNLDFLGRTDDQVKIRGYRVELGDIEAALAAHPGVARAAVIAKPDPNASGSHRLVGYVVAAGVAVGDTFDEDALVGQVRAQLKNVLPGYMVPSAIAVLAELPLTDNGKLNVRALPEVDPVVRRASGRPPQTPTEEVLCRLFGQVLGVDGVGADDDFFDLGGHSLLSIRLIGLVRSVLGVEMSLRDVFDAPTVAALAAILGEHRPSGAGPRAELAAVTRPTRIPTSPAQERLLILDQFGDAAVAYNYPLVFEVRGPLDVAALGAALGDVVDRHEALRTVFDEHDGVPFQRILPVGTPVPLQVVDCHEDQVQARVDEAAWRRFELSTEIPLRVSVIRVAPEVHTVAIILHHIATDEWSDAPLVADLNRAYAARRRGERAALPELPVQYPDYALWQRDRLAEIEEARLAFWREALAGAPDELTLPTDRPRPLRPSGAGGTMAVAVPADTAEALRTLAAHRQVSMLMLLHAGVATLLHRMGAGDDIVVGTPVAGRDDSALDELIGFFVNTVVLRVDASGNPSFDELLARVREADLSAFAHQDLPFERLVEALNPPRVAGRNPLFGVFVGYQLRDGDEAEMLGLPTQWRETDSTAAMFDLSFTLVDDRTGGATIMAEYGADLFDASTVRSLTHRLITLLGRIATDGATAIGAVDVLSDGEREALLIERNATTHDVDDVGLGALVARQAARTPNALAVVFDGDALDYAELDVWSDRVAAELVAACAGPGAIVGVSLPRSVELVVALVAVAKSGAAFLPLDPDYPPDRLQYMTSDASPAVVLDDANWVRTVRHGQGTARLGAVDPSGWAYVLYTSGTTGRPKGVAVPHAGIVNRIAWLQHAYPLGPEDRMLVKTPISFDTSVWEVFWPLAVGATLVVARPGGHRDPRYLAETMVSQGITAVDFVPSMLEPFLEEPAAADCASLTRVTVGGEALPTDVAARFAETVGVPLHNLYGPTEAAVDVLGWTADGGPVALGVPGWNVRVYVLDGYLDPVPIGAPGELYLAGVQLADGYLHRHGLTAQRFVASPFEAAARMYRTGDLVRWRADGQLEYLGRTDEQIKLRGVRIEPGEIETVLARHPSVSSARVVVRADRLVAYYLPAPGAEAASAEELRQHASAALPIHMVPSAYVELAEFPLTPSGKLNRRALPDPETTGGTGRPAVTPRQQRLAELFSEVLGVRVTSIDDDFFTLGGHSLLLVRLASVLRRAFGVDVGVADLMAAPTVAAVETVLAGHGDESAGAGLAPLLPLRAEGTEPPLFCLPPASGLSWQFAGLKRHLPQNVPLYGLQSPRFSGSALPATIAELATTYADLVDEVAPNGPIRLLGWSFGGSLALLVADELTRRGRDVTFVGMLDARTDVDPDEDFDPAAVLGGLLREMGFPVEAGARTTIEDAVALVRASGDAIAILDDVQIGRVVENYVAAERLTASADYGRYHGDVFFVDAAILEMDLEGVASQGWREHVGGELRVVTLPCRHSELMDAEVLDQLGPLIAAELSR